MSDFVTVERLRFFLREDINVILKGRHGVGKTSLVRQAFIEEGLKYRIYSAATMDPWVDFIGVPRAVPNGNGVMKRGCEHPINPGQSLPFCLTCGVPLFSSVDDEMVLKLARPAEWAHDEVQAIFFDEFNRCLTGDTLIRMADGTSVTISSLVGKPYFYVYSYDVKTKQVVIAKGHSARKTGKKQKLVKVTLDNGETIRCTPDHPFLMRDGSYKDAAQVKSGDSLMPLNTREYSGTDLSLNGYEQTYQPETGNWDFTHRLADEYNLRNGLSKLFKGRVRHHKDFNKHNNNPENITGISWTEHKILHSKIGSTGGKIAHQRHPDLFSRTIGSSVSRAKALQSSIQTRRNSKKYKKLRSQLSKQHFNIANRQEQANRCSQQWKNGQFDFDQKDAHAKRTRTIALRYGVSLLDSGNLSREGYQDAYDRVQGRGQGFLSLLKLEEHFGSFDNFAQRVKELAIVNNHKVVSVEDAGYEDVYDITVDEFHNFALASGIFVHNSHKKIRNAVMELIQFKSINDRKFPSLKVVWAAINPDDDTELEYDVEQIDPAQLDRFHVHLELPYKPNRKYFRDKFGPEIADTAINWWQGLPEGATGTVNIKNIVSPRRLDYALDVWKKGGSLEYVLPPASNVAALHSALKTTPVMQSLLTHFTVIREARENIINGNKLVTPLSELEDAATNFLSDENNYKLVIPTIVGKPAMIEILVPLLPEEKIADLLCSTQTVRMHYLRHLNESKVVLHIMEDIVSSNTNTNISREIGRALQRAKLDQVKTIDTQRTPNPNRTANYFAHKTNTDFSNVLQALQQQPKDNTYSRNSIYARIEDQIPDDVTLPDALICMVLLDDLIRSSHRKTISSWTHLVGIINTCVESMVKANWDFSTFAKKFPELAKYIISVDGFYFSIM